MYQTLNLKSSRILPVYVIITFLMLLVVLWAPFIGMELISIVDFLKEGIDKEIFFNLRLPRVILAFIAGSGLSLSGMVFQALFRNPLADPFTLGVSSGASWGAATMILFGITGSILGIPLISLGAFVGAILSMLLVYGLASLKKNLSSITLLLAGIAVSFLFSSFLMLLQYFSNFRDSFQIVRWLMGGIEIFGYKNLIYILPCYILGLLLIIPTLIELDHLLVGEDLAKSRGIAVQRVKFQLLIAVTLIVSSIVAYCGPIGFVGLMIPHATRRIGINTHRHLAPLSFLLGGTFLVACDTLSRVIIAPAEMPVGVITALLGGPFFLWILFARKSSHESLF